MHRSVIEPLADIQSDQRIIALPKADIHIHQEWSPRLDRVLARQEHRTPYDWRRWATQLMGTTPPGVLRLRQLGTILPAPQAADTDDSFIARVEDLLEEAAADGAVIVEPRFGGNTALRPGFMDLFCEAERRVRERYPQLRAAAVVMLQLWHHRERLEQMVRACEQAAKKGLGGIDFLYEPYDAEADWQTAYRIAERAVAVGLGITAHAGEFTTANIEAALRMPGLTRIGHAVYAAEEPHLLELLAERDITVECCLSCNVVLGAVASYEMHPIRCLLERGIAVTLCTDDPVQIGTTIGREYAIAALLGFSVDELLGCTRNALRASFTHVASQSELLAQVDSLSGVPAREQSPQSLPDGGCEKVIPIQ